MFEFSRFFPSDYEHGRDFVADLDKFLGNLPKAGLMPWRCGTSSGLRLITSPASPATA